MKNRPTIIKMYLVGSKFLPYHIQI